MKLLIGSRAIVQFVPSFREPKDWDIVASRTDFEQLRERLPDYPGTSNLPASSKLQLALGKESVEVESADACSYWSHVLEVFANVPTIDHPMLGVLGIPPLAFLLLLKQCQLAYQAVHWHKNLEDLYFLRGFVKEVSPAVTALARPTIEYAAGRYEKTHSKRSFPIQPCHREGGLVSARHSELHELLKLGDRAVRELPGAWLGFPEVTPAERTHMMVRLLAEEARVLAVEQVLRPDAEGKKRSPDEVARRVLRFLAMGPLPTSYRYFVVNYYREIMSLVGTDWSSIVEGFEPLATILGPCSLPTVQCGAPAGAVVIKHGHLDSVFDKPCDASASSPIPQ